MVPFVTGFTGYGNVSKGAQELYDLLPSIEIKPDEFTDFLKKGEFSNKVVYKIEFKEEDMYSHPSQNEFSFDHFLKFSNEYESLMHKYLPNLSMLVNGIYWEDRFPKHVTKKLMKNYYMNNQAQKLKVIGDITCDIEGSVELTVKATPSSNPSYVYEPLSGNVIDGVEGNGPVILAVDKLPAELPRQASKMFGDALLPYVKELASADYSVDFAELNIPKEFKNAIIAHKGKLTPDFQYLSKYL
jgi:alpha-aminoadipic semialdehyde synthase